MNPWIHLYSFAARYMDEADGCVREHFLTFYHAEGLVAANLASYIKQLVSSYDFDVKKMVSHAKSSCFVLEQQQIHPHKQPIKYRNFLILAGCAVVLLLLLFVIHMTLLYLL